ncbi:MAG: aminodeoxychorismate lyase, partial [Terrabacter sp.]|nr:aminodeoxychorismate lyase [Terrabacter sp.]
MKDHLETSIFGDHDEHLDEHLDAARHGEHFEEPHTSPAPMSRRELREAQEAARKGGRRKRAAATGVSGGGRGKPSVFRRLLVIVLALAVIGGGVAVAYKALRPVVESFLESNDYPGPGSGEVNVTVDEGARGSAIAKTLVDQDVVKSSKAFIEAANDNPKSAGIQPGIYTL